MKVNYNKIDRNFSEDPDSEICLPCSCSGSIKYVHVKCLKVMNSKNCIILNKAWIKSK